MSDQTLYRWFKFHQHGAIQSQTFWGLFPHKWDYTTQTDIAINSLYLLCAAYEQWSKCRVRAVDNLFPILKLFSTFRSNNTKLLLRSSSQTQLATMETGHKINLPFWIALRGVATVKQPRNSSIQRNQSCEVILVQYEHICTLSDKNDCITLVIPHPS